MVEDSFQENHSLGESAYDEEVCGFCKIQDLRNEQQELRVKLQRYREMLYEIRYRLESGNLQMIIDRRLEKFVSWMATRAEAELERTRQARTCNNGNDENDGGENIGNEDDGDDNDPATLPDAPASRSTVQNESLVVETSQAAELRARQQPAVRSLGTQQIVAKPDTPAVDLSTMDQIQMTLLEEYGDEEY